MFGQHTRDLIKLVIQVPLQQHRDVKHHSGQSQDGCSKPNNSHARRGRKEHCGDAFLRFIVRNSFHPPQAFSPFELETSLERHSFLGGRDAVLFHEKVERRGCQKFSLQKFPKTLRLQLCEHTSLSPRPLKQTHCPRILFRSQWKRLISPPRTSHHSPADNSVPPLVHGPTRNRRCKAVFRR